MELSSTQNATLQIVPEEFNVNNVKLCNFDGTDGARTRNFRRDRAVL